MRYAPLGGRMFFGIAPLGSCGRDDSALSRRSRALTSLAVTVRGSFIRVTRSLSSGTSPSPLPTTKSRRSALPMTFASRRFSWPMSCRTRCGLPSPSRITPGRPITRWTMSIWVVAALAGYGLATPAANGPRQVRAGAPILSGVSDIDEPVPEKRVSWAELYFDLVFVFAVTEVSVLLHGDHSGAGVLRALVLFVPLYWAWVGTSVHANTQDVENATDRVGIFGVGLASLFMALAVPDAYGHRGVLFGAGYLALRAVLAALFFRRRPVTLNSFSVGLAVTGPLLLAGGFAPDGWRLVLWTLAGLVDLATPALVRARLVSIRFDPAHLPERFGLLLLIALGESIVAVGENASHEPLRPSRLGAVALAFTVACGLWWVYFAFAAGAVRYAVATAEVQTDIIRQVLAYGHLCLIGAVIGVAVGLAEVVSRSTDRATT